jgi:hypothetical protein
MQAGLPRQALLMTVVRDLNDQGHVVLTIKTDRGEFVLDNLSEDIRPWDSTGYAYIKRQSQQDPNVWLSIEAPRKPLARTHQASPVRPGSKPEILGLADRGPASG